ncbi:Efflux pump membrane transporter BepG [compost metagenome]
MSLTVYFEVGRDPDQATIDVNNKVQAALAKLPEEVRRQGVKVEKKSSDILQVVTLYSPDNSRSSGFPAWAMPASSVPRTTPCASGCARTSWRSTTSPPPTWSTPSASRTPSSPPAASASSR